MKKLLLVDDFPSHRGMFKLIISKIGATVVEAQNGHDALVKLASDTFDAIVTDLEMPSMNGYDLIKHIRNQEHLGQVPIVVISGNKADWQRLEEFGVKKCICKPFNRETLAEEIQQVFS